MEVESTAINEGLDVEIESQASEGWCNQWIEVLISELALHRKCSNCCC